MTRPAWTTVAIPTELYEEIKRLHVPDRAKSVQAYVNFWVRAGTLIDRAMATTPRNGNVLEHVLQILKAIDAKKP